MTIPETSWPLMQNEQWAGSKNAPGLGSVSFSVMAPGLFFCSLVEAFDVVNVGNIGFDVFAPCRNVIGFELCR